MLLDAAPKNVLYVQELAAAHVRAGSHSYGLEDLDAATEHYQSAERLVSRILDVEPDDDRARQCKTSLQRCHAIVETKRGNFASAAEHVQTYLALLETTPFSAEERLRFRALGWDLKFQIALGREDRDAAKDASHEVELLIDEMLQPESVSAATWASAARISSELALQGYMPAEKALRIARAACATDANAPNLLVLGDALRAAGRKNEACESYARALEITAPAPNLRRTQIESHMQDCRDAVSSSELSD